MRGRRRRSPAGRGAALGLVLAVLAVSSAAARDRPFRAGIWVSSAELKNLPTSGRAWEKLKHNADRKLKRANIAGQDNTHDTKLLAVALVYARTHQAGYRRKAAGGIIDAIGSERHGRSLALGRSLISYVLAADLIDLEHFDRRKARAFAKWLKKVRWERLRPRKRPTLIATHELAANNWGTHAGASRIAADVYLGDEKDLARAAAVFKGWLGDRDTYSGFDFRYDRSWQADPAAPVGVNPAGAVKDGHVIDGALPDDMRRGCPLRFPPCATGYPWEAMQGALMQAELLYRQGYDAWNWGDQALLRAARFLMTLHRDYPDVAEWAPAGDDSWIPWLLDARYGAQLPTETPTKPGKGVGYADWVYSRSSPCEGESCRAPRGPVRTVAPVKERRAFLLARPGHRVPATDTTRPGAHRTRAGIAIVVTLMLATLMLAFGRRRRGVREARTQP